MAAPVPWSMRQTERTARTHGGNRWHQRHGESGAAAVLQASTGTGTFGESRG